MALKEVSGNKTNLSRAFKDIAMGFRRNTVTKDTGIVKNENSIKQSIRNLILTQKGERLMQPDIGCDVFSLLFEPLDPMTADAVRDEIINTINQYEPRVSLIDVTVNTVEVYNKFDVTVEYRIVGQPIVEEVDFVLKRPE